MVNKIPNPNDGLAHVHQLPGERGTAQRRNRSALDCPEVDRISALERQVAELQTRDPPRDVITTAVKELPRAEIERIDRLEREWQRVQSSSDVVVPRGMSEIYEGLEQIVERIKVLEQAPRDITPAPPSDISERVETIEEFVKSYNAHDTTQVEALRTALLALRGALNHAHQRIVDLESESMMTNRRLDAVRGVFEKYAEVQ